MKRRALIAALAAAATSACGYALVGRGTIVDPEIKKIGVPLFKDATGKPGMDQKITQKVIEELLKRGRFEVVQEAAGVDARVDGELLRYDVQPVGFTGTEASAAGNTTSGQATRYVITITARVSYTKTRHAGEEKPEPIWSQDNFTFRDEYDIGTEAQTFFDREGQAQDRLASQFARNLVGAMLEAF